MNQLDDPDPNTSPCLSTVDWNDYASPAEPPGFCYSKTNA